MSTNKMNLLLRASLKSGVAILPLAVAVVSMPAFAQPKTQAQLEAEAAKAKAEAATGADADDAAAISQLLGGQTGTSKSTQSTRDIVVVGTNIRGVAPTGSQPSVVSKEDIAATGQTSINQLLTTIPGFSNFNSVTNNGGAAAQGGTAVLRPNLRGTPDGDLGSAGVGDPGSATLILIDGNRQSGAGIRQQATDPDSISPALLERVEVNTDGGSAAYGSDAIGGVVNFVTRKRFDGAQISARLGYADKYTQYDANGLFGKDWGSGSAYVAGNYAYNTPLWRRDRAWANPIALDTGLQQGLNCDTPNISIASLPATGTAGTFAPAIPVHYYKLNPDGSVSRGGDVIVNNIRTAAGTQTPTGGVATTLPAEGAPAATINGASVNTLPNLCTNSRNGMKVNQNKRYGFNASFFQKITDDVDFHLQGRYSYVSTFNVDTPLSINVPVGANNPWRQELVNGADGFTSLSPVVTPGTSGAIYPIAQPGYPTPINDAFRACTGAGAVSATNPVPCNGNLLGTVQPVPQTVLTNLGPVYGPNNNYAHNWDKSFGGTADVTWRIDGNWLFRATGVYDRTTTKTQYGQSSFSGAAAYLGPYLDTGNVCAAAEATYATAGGNTAANTGNPAALAARAIARQSCLDPYNPALSNPTLLKAGNNVDSKSLAHEAIIDIKGNLDGALFSIPGGKVKIAVGGEYLQEDFEKWQYSSGLPVGFDQVHGTFTAATTPTISSIGSPVGWAPALFAAGSRYTYSAYGEINVPLVSRANELTWVKEFRVSASVRYDKVKIFGTTINPRFGASFKPTNWLNLRGQWNTSFRAPNIVLSVGAESAQITIDPVPGGTTNIQAANPQVPNGYVLWIYNAGARKNLKPQTGAQWSAAFDLTPFRGFKASLQYSHIDYRNALTTGAPSTGSRGSILALENLGGLTGLPGQGCTEADNVIVLYDQTAACTAAQLAQNANPQTTLTPAQVAAAKAFFAADALNAAAVLADGRPVYGLYDTRYRNSGNSKIGNVDYNLRYSTSTSWGSAFFSLTGTIAVIRKSQSTDFTPYVANGPLSITSPGSRHQLTAQSGFSYGPLHASATLLHSDGYNVPRSATSPQDRVDDYNVVNAFMTWDFKGDNVVERGLQLSLNVNNVFNTAPPVRYSNNTVSFANGDTIGRLIQAGFTKKF